MGKDQSVMATTCLQVAKVQLFFSIPHAYTYFKHACTYLIILHMLAGGKSPSLLLIINHISSSTCLRIVRLVSFSS